MFISAEDSNFDKHETVKNVVHAAMNDFDYSKPVYITDLKHEADSKKVRDHVMIYTWESNWAEENETYQIGVNEHAIRRLTERFISNVNPKFWQVYDAAKPIIVDFGLNNTRVLCNLLKAHPSEIFRNVRLGDAA